MPILHDMDAAWLAGFIDADGHIGLGKRSDQWISESGRRPHYYRPIVQIGQAKRDVLEHISTLIGGASISSHGGRERQMWNLKLSHPQVRWVLPCLIPHLRVKERQARLVMEFMGQTKAHGKSITDEQQARRDAIHAELASLNMKPAAVLRIAEERVADA